MDSKPKNSFSTLDIILLSLASLLIFFVLRAKVYNLVSYQKQRQNFQLLTFAIPFSLFFFQFRALRKKIVFLCWIALSLVLLFVCIIYYNDATLNLTDKNSNVHNCAHGLAGTFVFLIWYQGWRQLSLKFYGFEMGMAGRSNYIIEEERNATIIDRVCSAGIFIIPFLPPLI